MTIQRYEIPHKKNTDSQIPVNNSLGFNLFNFVKKRQYIKEPIFLKYTNSHHWLIQFYKYDTKLYIKKQLHKIFSPNLTH